ncbi:MAG TPA: hypothetical protein EYG51_08740 [Pseudomonadales bacterium]|nr:hypothetical protein [Pseudomonadales bacterium]
MTEGKGVDGVLVCAGTSSNQPIEVSGEVTREKGRVVVIGAVRMDIPREHYFRKEISLVISRSYGPGRYDSSYEESGLDYPYGYVRFTEQRNMVTFLGLVEKKSIDIDSLITHRFPLDDASSAYSMIAGDRIEPYLGILLEYQKPVPGNETKRVAESVGKPLATGKVGISLYGAGNYATASLLPALNSLQQVEFRGVSTASGRTAKTVSDRFGFQFAADDLSQILADKSDVVMIASRHDSHASSVVAAIELGKRVYVEKPLALTLEELANIHQTVTKKKSVNLMVGFNRRFAPMTIALMNHFQDCQSPLVVNLRVNAGALPDDHWTLDPLIGGGRLIGEGCHFLDLAGAICGSKIASVFAVATSKPNKSALLNDNFCICASFGNGSVANITYTADGSKALSKERIEVFGGGRSGVIVDFRELVLYENEKKTVHRKKLSQDKGQQAMLAIWLDQLADGNNCISYEALMNTSIAAIKSIESLIINQPMQVDISALDVE